MALVSLHYWAGARAAAGVETETIQTTSVAGALRQAEAARDDPRFSRVIKACSLLVDGVAAKPADLERALTGPVRVDVLPPFAGGATCVCAHSATILASSFHCLNKQCDINHANRLPSDRSSRMSDSNLIM